MSAVKKTLPAEQVSPLSFENISVGYGAFRVASDVNITLKSGHIHGLIGLNGVGKTTLIKTLLGLRDPQEGHISIFGETCGTLKAKKKISYLPERFDPPWFLTGLEFVRFSAKLYNATISDKDIFEMAEKLSLDTNFLSQKAQSYSKGMRQKLGLIATVLMPAKLLILDEPMSGLDPLARVQVKDVLEVCRDAGKTIFLSSHILADLDEMCEDISILHGGAIVYSGSPEALRKKTKEKSLERAFLKSIAS